MIFVRNLAVTLFAAVLLFACERPSSPDFTLQHAIQIPVISNRTIEFIGGANALIDTTKADFEDLFSIDGDGLVRVVTEMDFNIGDFDDMFPELEVSPTDVLAEIGLIEVSFTGKGSSSYEAVTGVPASGAPGPGSPITAGQSPEMSVELEVSDFENGVIDSGGISVRFTNHLGFDISELEATLWSGGVPVSGPEQLSGIASGDDKTLTFLFQSQDEISVPVMVRIQVDWNAQTVTSEPGDLLIQAFDDELLAQNVTAVIRNQDFFSNDLIDVDDDEFRFEHPSHYVEVDQGAIVIESIMNRIDLDIDTLVISFPGILHPPFHAGDSLVIEITGSDRIRRMETRMSVRHTDLSGHRIKALDNVIRYNLSGITENTRFHAQADSFRTVDASDYVDAHIVISELQLHEVFGVVQPKSILLNNDEGNDRQLDLDNPLEAEITELEDLEFLSGRVKNITFYDPNLNLTYRSNIGVPSRVYSAILGINADGEEVFLQPSVANPVYRWTSADTIQGLVYKGSDIPVEQRIAFNVEPGSDPYADPVPRTISFTEENSNISEFISNLPVEIRFIGKSVANMDGDEGMVVDPVLFDTSLDLDIPLNFATETPGSYQDTLEADFGFLPDQDSDTRVAEATVSILYENRLPVELGINLEFLDEWGEIISSLPLTEEQQSLLVLNAAPVDGISRFANGISTGLLQLSLEEDQLETLYRTRNIRVSGDFMTSIQNASSEIKIRFDDYFQFSLGIDVSITTRIN